MWGVCFPSKRLIICSLCSRLYFFFQPSTSSFMQSNTALTPPLHFTWWVCFKVTHLLLTPTIAFIQLVVLNASSIPGRVFASLLTKRYGAFNVYIPVGACCAVISFALFGVTSTGTIFTFAILFGLFAGGCTFYIFLPAYWRHSPCLQSSRFTR
jgi:hypothetical protein